MILLVCSCGTAVRTAGDPDEVNHLLGEACDWFPDRYPCPRAGCTKHMRLMSAATVIETSELEIFDVTVQEAFAAIQGLGLPLERDCGESALKGLQGKILTEISAVQIRGSNRSVVYHIAFDDGTKLFFGAGVEGAIAYRLAKPRHYVEEALNEASSS